MKKYKKNLFITFCVLSLLLSHYIIALLGGNLIFRYFGYGISTFFIILLSLKMLGFSKHLYLLTIPILINFLVSVHSASVGGTVIIPLGIIGIVSMIFAFFTYKKSLKEKSIKFNVTIFSVFMILSTYIYGNWIYGKNEDILDKTFSSKLTLVDDQGEKFNLKDKKGQVIVFDFWSSNCGVCFKKFPDFEKQYFNYQSDTLVSLYSLNLPIRGDDSARVRKMISKYKFEKLFINEISAWEELDIKGVPTLIMIDKKGEIRFKGNLNSNKLIFYNNFNNLIKLLRDE